MRPIRWTERALTDLESALAFIAKESPAHAQLVRERVLSTVHNLEAFSLGLPAPKGHLKLYVPKTSYFVIFERTKAEDGIVILAFIHASRDWEQIDWETLR